MKTARQAGAAAAALSHLDAEGNARMVDVAGKADDARARRSPRPTVVMGAATWALVAAGEIPKGDVLAAARLAGIMAAKRTPDLIPLCHPLLLSQVDVDLRRAPGRAGEDRAAHPRGRALHRARPASRWRR